MEFQLGDVVRLKSGGPRMTVENLGDRLGDEVVCCVWFEKVGNKQIVKRDAFPPITLEMAPKSGLGTAGLSRT